MKKRTILTAAIAVLLVAVLVVGGSLAYFTDNETNTNTFTVGNVEISLKEHDVTKGEDGKYTAGNGYATAGVDYEGVYPGAYLPKDPVVTVKQGSSPCYLRVKIVVNKNAELWNAFDCGLKYTVGGVLTDDGTAVFSNMIKNLVAFGGYDCAWKLSDGTIGYDTTTAYTDNDYSSLLANNEKIFILYFGVVDASTEAKSFTLFEGINVPTENSDEVSAVFNGLNVKITAEAIQSEGFASEGAAWDAFDAQNP